MACAADAEVKVEMQRHERDPVLPRTSAVNLAGWSRRNTSSTLKLSHGARQVGPRPDKCECDTGEV